MVAADPWAGGRPFTPDHAALDQLLHARSVRSLYQPVVELDTDLVVGYEALAWGPVGSPLEWPDRLFETARQADKLDELDWVCRWAALSGALDGGLGRDLTLFVNVEAATLGSSPPEDLAYVIEAAQTDLRVILEVTGRALLQRPAELLAAIDWARQRGWGVALDDVGAHPDSLTLVPLVKPDVVKLDMRLTHDQTTADVARIATAVLAYAERSGATILAEGIETDEHVERAVALGASLGQGWRFGRPGPLSVPRGPVGPKVPFLPAVSSTTSLTPFEIASDRLRPRPARPAVLASVSRHLEAQANSAPTPPVLLAAFQEATRFTPATARRYQRLAETCPFVGAVGFGMKDEPAPGVRGASFDSEDPLRDEWTVVVVGPHYAGALMARDLGDSGPADQRRYHFVVTHDTDLVLAAADSLMRRVVSVDGPTGFLA